MSVDAIECAIRHGWAVVVHSETERGTVRKTAALFNLPCPRIVVRVLPQGDA